MTKIPVSHITFFILHLFSSCRRLACGSSFFILYHMVSFFGKPENMHKKTVAKVSSLTAPTKYRGRPLFQEISFCNSFLCYHCLLLLFYNRDRYLIYRGSKICFRCRDLDDISIRAGLVVGRCHKRDSSSCHRQVRCRRQGRCMFDHRIRDRILPL